MRRKRLPGGRLWEKGEACKDWTSVSMPLEDFTAEAVELILARLQSRRILASRPRNCGLAAAEPHKPGNRHGSLGAAGRR